MSPVSNKKISAVNFKKLLLGWGMCVPVCTCIYGGGPQHLYGGQRTICGISYLLSFCGLQGWDSGHQACLVSAFT